MRLTLKGTGAGKYSNAHTVMGDVVSPVAGVVGDSR